MFNVSAKVAGYFDLDLADVAIICIYSFLCDSR